MSDRSTHNLAHFEQLGDDMLDMLTKRATEPLSQAEHQELANAGLLNIDDVDLAAAAFDVAYLQEQSAHAIHDMPESVLIKLQASAEAFDAAPDQAAPAPAAPTSTPTVIYKISPTGYLGWAMAAMLAIVASIGWLRPPSPDATISAQSLYTNLTSAASPQVVKAEWGAIDAQTHPDFSGVTGEIVFDPETQQGVMRFVGLPKNLPDDFQYQLWIVDPTRDTEPVDGGVFDAAETRQGNGEIYVLVNAKLLAEKPQAFVITVEHPGGVVESDPANYRLLAQPESPPAIDG